MIDFYKIDNNIITELKEIENDGIYALTKEKEIIGYGIKTKDCKNKLQIIIKEEYRSNGYGKLLFGKMLEELKKENYNEIKLTFNRDNYRIKNIIIYYGGIQLHTNEKEETYILSIK